MKSILLINGNDPKALLNSTLYGADAVAYDLHEAVSADDKDAARLLLQEALAFFDFGDSGVFVRVNPMDEGGGEDIAVAGKGKPQAFILPRADAQSLPQADAAIAALEAANGFAAGSVKLIPTVESVAALENISALLSSCPRIMAVIFNAGNFLKDLGVAETGDAGQILYARSKVALACRAVGIPAIDRPWNDVKNRDGFEADARNGRAVGFSGKLAVSGGQVPPINEIFA
ncbi:citrate lyase subunit beta [Desulfovibrio sp. PG-178-WT-4]|uniref:Citrate lyase subunit beta n=1 Tax=Desulfovibrio porci TaxID=2605782 RepID=A0A6L5XNN4_9BACT|nr:aldolase/citrate lyase family protein [Desulfovibrio porci]MDY3810263.1 aldolase/citrate lyase family protein [Desulfovibrio porci]MSS28715.1 citrate lyase subunit beta [Desulfovibrio porci]